MLTKLYTLKYRRKQNEISLNRWMGKCAVTYSSTWVLICSFENEFSLWEIVCSLFTFNFLTVQFKSNQSLFKGKCETV